MASEIYFTSARSTVWEHWYSLPDRLEELLARADISRYVSPGEYVAIKMHLGSEGNHRTIRPTFVRKVVEAVKAVGSQPFVTETTRIPGLKYLEVANTNGYNAQSLGAPVIMADGIFGHDSIPVKVEGGECIREIGVASAIYHAPAMIVLSHCKGHVGSGYGGSIKNLAMGGIGVRTQDGGTNRGRLHSLEDQPPQWTDERCIWCLKCEEICPKEAIAIEPEVSWSVDEELCDRCGRCVRVCEEEALSMPISEELFARGMAESVKAVLSTFAPGKVLYINFVLEVIPECDCMPVADVPVVQDQGILLGDDIVAIDQASLDMINAALPLPQSKAEDKGITGPSDILHKINKKDPQLAIDRAAELGLGCKEYKLVTVERKRAAT